MIQPDETWKKITKQTLHKLDEITRYKVLLYTKEETSYQGNINSCFDCFNWATTPEGLKYWSNKFAISAKFKIRVNHHTVRDFMLSLYPSSEYPEYYI